METYSWLEKLLFPSVSVNKQALRQMLQGKTIVITGASSGIGEHLAMYLAGLDVSLTLVLVARRGERLAALQQQYASQSVQIVTMSADLRDEKALAQFCSLCHQLPNGVDYVISNAGLSIRRSIFKSLDRMHDFTRTMAINYMAPVQLLLSFIPLLEKNKGHIIHISTINTRMVPVPHWAAYQASKAAFDTWFQSVAPELRAAGIATSTIYLPLVKTPMIAPTKAYANAPAMSTAQAVQMIARAMVKRGRSYQPWWLIFAQLASVTCRKIFDLVFVKAVKKERV